MASNVLPDPSTPFGERLRGRLRDEPVLWLTTVGDDGTPQPNPVWFLWDGHTFLVYNRADAHRLRHVRARPNVALNFDGNGQGGDIAVVTGRAELPEGEPPPHEVPAYVAKYGKRMAAISGSLEAFSAAYPVPMRIRPRKVRGS
ncbi:MAG TPA: TIGR03667 family PPOX class F420-dependent oxidoreductase [Candidatus Eisenbacteria bacterium]|nr:TIGR03667 family PPOX class F420-dependent oxidoreductase [Candidatus Eisenbacteria bacterium]